MNPRAQKIKCWCGKERIWGVFNIWLVFKPKTVDDINQGDREENPEQFPKGVYEGMLEDRRKISQDNSLI